jgi:peptidoglycan/xylan/chitin deacetylase (PgdA/CDA1 family)
MLVFLVYHKVQDDGEGDIYTISPTDFLAQLSTVQQASLPIINPRMLSESKNYPQHGIVFTFDDGTSDHFRNVRSLLREFAVPALFYVSTGKLDRNGYLSQEQVRLLWEDGHIIGSHAHSHKRLDVMPMTQVRQELELSAIAIQNITGQRPVHFALPGGFYNRSVQEVAQEVGYVFCRTMDWGYNKIFNPMQIEIVPMTDALGTYFLKHALHGRLERVLKFTYYLKNRLRTFLPKSRYGRFRARITCFLRER